MLSQREKRIINLFDVRTQNLTAKEISTQLNISERTVRSDIKKINQNQAFVKIESHRGLGYSLKILDILTYNKLVTNPVHGSTLPTSERVLRIMKILLMEDSYVRIDDIAERLYSSPVIISKDLQHIRSQFHAYGIEIETKPHHGIRIRGDEFNIRSCMSEYLYHRGDKENEYFFDRKKRSAILDILRQDGVVMSSLQFNSFIIHLDIMMIALKRGHDYIANGNPINDIKNRYEYFVAKDIKHVLESMYDVEISQDEELYICLHIIGKQTNFGSIIENCSNDVLNIETYDLVDKILNNINQKYRVDFTKDMYLKNALALYLDGMILRAQYGLFRRNAQVREIKRNYLASYYIALETILNMLPQLNNSVLVAESANLALHLQYAYERIQVQGKRDLVTILVEDYTVQSELLDFNVKKKLGHELQVASILTERDFYKKGINFNIDFILSTLPKRIDNSEVPIVYISNFLNDEDMKTIKDHIAVSHTDDPIDVFNLTYTYETHNALIEMIRNLKTDVKISNSELILKQGIEIDNYLIYFNYGSSKNAVYLYDLNEEVQWVDQMIAHVAIVQIQNNQDIYELVDSLQMIN